MSDSSYHPAFLPYDGLSRLVSALRARGFRVVGPKLEDGVIAFREYADDDEPPRGIQAQQSPASYRLAKDSEQRYFAWANGPQALKPWLFAPEEPLWRSESRSDGLGFVEIVPQTMPVAVIGVRACDLAALSIQDKHFLYGPYRNEHYARRRAGLFIVAVQCAEPASTCFCASTGDGPAPRSGFDIALTELSMGFVASARSESGARVLSSLALSGASEAQLDQARQQEQEAISKQTRSLPGRNLKQSLLDRLEHPRWNEVAARCLSCGNCTAVCPTCFCHAQEIKPEISGDRAVAIRKWDNCFGESHGYIHGFQVRPDARARYRQWLVHKLGTWHDQFGRSGCVGCGRCITWCPAGIDITEEASALMEQA
jgi:sulfhydrogenase subunit beta (sulfur reductase)